MYCLYSMFGPLANVDWKQSPLQGWDMLLKYFNLINAAENMYVVVSMTFQMKKYVERFGDYYANPRSAG